MGSGLRKEGCIGWRGEGEEENLVERKEHDANWLIECEKKRREDWEGTRLYYLLVESEA